MKTATVGDTTYEFPDEWSDDQIVSHLSQKTATTLSPATATAPKNYTLGEIPHAAASNALSSFGNIVKGIGTAIAHPIDTATGAVKTAAGAVEKLIPESLLPAGRVNEKYADAFGAYMANRYGGWENLKRTIAEDPAGFAADVSTLFSGGGAALKASGLPTVGKVVSKTGSFIDPTQHLVEATKLAGKGLGKVGEFTVGLTTGKGKGTITDVYNLAKKGGPAQEAMLETLRGKSSSLDTANELQDAYQTLKDKRGADYSQKLGQIAQTSGNTALDTTPVDNAINDVAKRFRITNISMQPVNGPGGALTMERKLEGLSTLTPADKVEFNRMLDMIDEWKNHPDGKTALGLDALKQQLDNFYTPNARIGAVATGLKNSVRDILERSVPGYKEMTTEYNRASDMLAELKSATSAGSKNKTQTLIRKTGTIMREDSDFGRDLIKSLDQTVGSNVLPKMAGTQMNAWLPTGLVGRGLDASLLYGLASGGFSAGMPVLAAIGSPRLAGETLNMLGSGMRYAGKTAPYFKSQYTLPAYQLGRMENEQEERK